MSFFAIANRPIFLAYFSACATLLLGCGSSSSNATPSDAGAASDANDVGDEDASADAGPVRTLTTVPFLEGVSTQERVVDPAMEMIGWFFYDTSDPNGATLVDRVAFANAPAGQVGAFISSVKNPKGVSFGAQFKLPGTTYTGSIWLGAVGKNPSGVTPALITFDQGGTGTQHYYELIADASTVTTIGVITWEKFHVDAPAELVSGWGYVYAQTDGTQDIYVQSASVLDASAKIGKSIAKPSALPLAAQKFLDAAKAHQPKPTPPRVQRRFHALTK